MLTGPALGAAIEAARLKKPVSKRELAEHFGVKPPSVQDWVRRGTIDKAKLPALWLYFADVAGPSHWGLAAWPVLETLPAPATVKESLTPQPPTPAEVVSQLAAVLRTVPRAQRAEVAGALAALARGPDSNDLAADVLDALASTAPPAVQDLPSEAAA